MNGYITVRERHASSSSRWTSVKYNKLVLQYIMFKYLSKVPLFNIQIFRTFREIRLCQWFMHVLYTNSYL